MGFPTKESLNFFFGLGSRGIFGYKIAIPPGARTHLPKKEVKLQTLDELIIDNMLVTSWMSYLMTGHLERFKVFLSIFGSFQLRLNMLENPQIFEVELPKHNSYTPMFTSIVVGNRDLEYFM